MRFIFLVFLLISTNAMATTWADSEVDDPFNVGAKCMVEKPASSGSYIYQWPSKYDQVFWPLTTMRGIWYCETSGYIAFISDFEKLTETEKKKIKKYLTNNNSKLKSIESKLKRLEAIYSIREKSAEFKNRLKRILAYLYEKDGKVKLANQYRSFALKEITITLQGKLKDFKHLEYLYLAANYHRQFGELIKSDFYILKLKDTIENNNNSEVQSYKDYLTKLSEDTKYITKGGVLMPSLPEDDA